MSRFKQYINEMKILSFDLIQKKRKGYYYFSIDNITEEVK